MIRVRWTECAVVGAMLLWAHLAEAKGRSILATGRRDPRIYAIDFDQALRPENNNTPNAIVSRSLVNPRRLDGALLGDPANIVLSEDQETAFVMNHHGGVVNAEFLQHGGRANVAVMNVRKMLERELDDTDAALEHNFDAGWFGGVGILVVPGLIVAGYSEGWLTEDGSNRIGLLDRRTGGIRGQIEMPLTGRGTRQLRKGCAFFPVPFFSPTEPPQIPDGEAFLSDIDPHDFGCWPDPEGLALAHGSDGKTYLVSGNAGTEDVSIMDFDAALEGSRVVEQPKVAPRIPVQTGPFGIRASPNGKFIAVTARESNITGKAGNTISIIDIDLARQGLPGAEAARVQVGTDSPTGEARPFTVSWTPDGKRIVVANFLTNNVSIVDLKTALHHPTGAEIARIPLTRPDGKDARPKGTFVTSDGRHAVVTGGGNTLSKGNAPTGTVFVIDLRTNAQVATVTGVGIDPYNLVVVEGLDD
ncbi:MAG: YncE family protein [Deltaproteobacteria bacterium]|nr:MAG: YncE family protein [Deltaproteobacteria bacterium]